MPRTSTAGGFDLIAVLPLLCIFAVLILSLALGHHGSPPGPDDPDDGRGSGPPGPVVPEPPRGGVPLADSVQARVRLRTHERLADRIPGRTRRPAHAPGREPAPTR